MDSSKVWLMKNAKKVNVLQNAVDDMFCETSKLISYPHIAKLNKPYLLCVCTYSKQKNQIGILREYFKSGVEACLVFIGPEKQNIIIYCKKK